MEAEPYHHKLLIEVIEHFSAAQPAAPIHLQLQKSSQTGIVQHDAWLQGDWYIVGLCNQANPFRH